MVQTKYFDFAATTTVRKRPDGTHAEGCGHSQHLYVGRAHGATGDYASYLLPTFDWTGLTGGGVIESAYLVIYADDQNTAQFPTPSPSDTPLFYIRRLTSAFTAGNNSDGSFDSTDYTAPKATTSGQIEVAGNKAANGIVRINITALLRQFAPATIAGGGGVHNYGIGLFERNTSEAHGWSAWSRYAPDPHLTQRPQIEVNFSYGLVKPDLPTTLVPVGGAAPVVFGGDFSSAKTDNTLGYTEVEVYPDASTDSVLGTAVWTSGKYVAGADAIANARFAVPYLGPALVVGQSYKWRARVTDNQAQTSNWTSLTEFDLSNNAPDAPTLTPAAQTYASLNGVQFGVSYHDTDGDAMQAWQVQLAVAAPDDANPDLNLWDTGKSYVGLTGTGAQRVYGGEPLAAWTYHWRARVWDAKGSASDWTTTTVTLTADFSAEPGTQDVVQFNPRAPWRVRIHAMGTDRGPGELVAIFEHAKSVGASVMYNSPGEFHMTLTVDDPQLGVVEPKQTHYGVDTYTGDGWREAFAGLMWDVDATETSAVFTGIDYLGLLDLDQDERFDPASIDKPTTKGGSKYVNTTIHDIVVDQLNETTGKANSLVGFIGVGSVAAMNERVTIYSTFEPRLSFIAGLLDSHRQGTGKNTRISVYRESEGVYKFRVVDDPGTERPDMQMRYGEYVQGYRVIVFGRAWLNRINAIGRTRDGVKVFYKSMDAPGIDQSVWGRIAQAQVFDGVTDENDLIRRMTQAAVHTSKLGHSMAVGIRSNLIAPLYGYDVCDAIPMEIVHGAVDTTRYGSGFWVVYGVAWETTDDGGTDTTLTLLPRDDSTPPDDDLIPSVPMSPQAEWQIGWQAPDPVTATSRFWLDQTTGIAYIRTADPTTGDATYTAIDSPGGLTNPALPTPPTLDAPTTSTIIDSDGHVIVKALMPYHPSGSATTASVIVQWTDVFSGLDPVWTNASHGIVRKL